MALTGNSDESINMTGYDSLSLGTAIDCSYTGTCMNPDNNTCIFGGGGGTLALPNALADVGGMATSVVIQGNVTFTAINSYSGTTTISAGTLQLGDGSHDCLVRDGRCDRQLLLVFNCADNTAIGNAISGTGSLTQEGTDTVTLTGSIVLRLHDDFRRHAADRCGDTGSLGTGVVVDNSSLVFDCGTGVTLPDAIEGTGSLTQEAGYADTYRPKFRFRHATISAGTLQIDAGGPIGSLGTGPVTDDSALVFKRSDDVTVDNSISGSGSLTQAGSGTLTLTAADNSYGATIVSAGTRYRSGRNTGSLGSAMSLTPPRWCWITPPAAAR